MKTEDTLWLVWSMEHRAWWATNRNGYTSSKDNAGRYSFEEACEIVKNANTAPECRIFPNEAMILDYE